MEIFLIRHGRTIENEMGIWQGHEDGELSDSGKRQAQEVAAGLRFEKFKAIYSSDLGRAMQTAAYIAAYCPEVVFFSDARLRERCYGVYDGTDIEVLFSEYKDETPHSKPEGGESTAKFRTRLNDFFQMLKSEYSRKDKVAVVTHYGPLVNLLNLAAGEKIEHIIKDPEEVDNCQVTRLLV